MTSEAMAAVRAAEEDEETTGREVTLVPQNVVTPYTKLLEVAATSGNPELFEKTMALEERWHQTQARRAFDRAMAAAYAEIPIITKSRQVDFGAGRASYWYEDFADIVETVKPILSKHGMYLRHTGRNDVATGIVYVTCILGHEAGHRETSDFECKIDNSGNKNPVQALGSAGTYLQRYTSKMALGLAAAVDDDGRAAGLKGQRKPPSASGKKDPGVVIDQPEVSGSYKPEAKDGPPFAIPHTGRNPAHWAEDYKATLRNAKTPREIAVWAQLNARPLTQLSQAYPDLRQSIDDLTNDLLSGGESTKAEAKTKKPPSAKAAESDVDSAQWRKDMEGALSGCETEDDIKKYRAEIDGAPDGVLKADLDLVEAAFKQTVDRVMLGK